MADYKDYIVRYDIQADVTKAAEGLQSIANIAKEFENPMRELSAAIKQVSQSAFQLKQNANITFAPKIDVGAFNNQLRNMVVQVRSAAAEMHAAIFESLSGNASATKAMQKGISSALGSNKSINDLKSDIAAYNKELDKLLGTPVTKKGKTTRNRDGAIQMAKNAKLDDRVLELESRKQMLQKLIKQRKADLAIAEELEKSASTKQVKTDSGVKRQIKSSTTNAQPAKLTNVTPTVIREWKKAFGDAKSKSLTINIRGYAGGANGALTVIKQVQSSLEALQAKSVFNITPMLNMEAFVATEAKLKELSKLSSSAVYPLDTKDKKGNLSETKRQVQKAKEAIPVNVKIMSDQVAASIKSIPRQTLPVSIKLMWEKGAVGRQEQLKNISSKIPPITLTLDTKSAIAKFEEFISLIKSNSVQNIQLTASGNASNAATKASSSASASSTSVIAGGNNNAATKNKSLTAQERYAKLKENAVKNAEKAKASGKQMVLKGQEVRAKEQAWYAQQQAMYNRLFEAVPKPDYGWLQRQEIQRNSELLKMREDARSAFAKPTPFEQKEMADRKTAVSNSIARHQQKAERLRSQAYNSMLPFAQNKEQANMMAKHRKYFRQAVTTTGITPTPGMEAPQMLKYLQGVSNQMQSASVAVPWQLQSQINKLEAQIEKSKGVTGKSSVQRVSTATVGSQKSFFDQSRKWAYPFTGQTSFGARTPMAVDMAKGAGVMFAVGGAMSAISGAFNEAVEYQNTMRTTQSILKHGTDSYTQDSFKNMERTVRDVGVKTKFSSSEVADAAKFLAMAGYDIEAINAAIAPIADLALIGDSNLGETADKMTNIMTTFQIAPNRMREAANIMATTATRSNTDLMMLAESAKYGGGVANMYGRNDPNLFGDTMALFGVMGNAGIQASSAGTALRMMYMNMFNPNKKQKALLDMLEKTYGIKRFKDNGDYRAMSDILIDMAQRIPENKMAEVVGRLFRVTAQPGANAALIAAAGGDLNNEQEIVSGFNSVGDKILQEGLGPLISLMKANRESVNGNISGDIAGSKQNTLKGLWAQVTSTFEEGILVTLEKRQGEFENMLRKLSEYFAKPETIQMMQNLIDMIVDIGKVMAGFVKIWAELYNMAPGLIKFWVTTQMLFTQIGTLISPVVSLIGVFNRLGGVIEKLSGVSIAGGIAMTKATSGRIIASSAANSALMGTSFAVGGPNLIRGNAAVRANRELASNAILAGELALSGASKKETLETLNSGTRQHYAEVRKRANKIYGTARAGRAFKAAATAVPTMATFAPMMGGVKNLFVGLLTSLAKAIGFLVNPITLAVGALGTLGFGVYKLFQFVNGNTEAQILAQQEMAQKSAEATRAMISNSQWYKEQLDKFKNPAQQLESVGKSQKQLEYEKNANNFKGENADVLADLTKNASYKGIDQQVASWRERFNSNPLLKFAIGKDYDKFVGDGLTKDNLQPEYTGTDADGGIALYNWLFGAKNKAKFVQNKQIQAALRTAGANHPAIQNANEQIANLRQQFFDGTINEDEYYKQAYKIRDSIVNLNDPKLRSSAGMTLEQFSNISDPSVYKEYAIGQYNIINSFIAGEYGSLVGKLNAYKELRNGIEIYSDKWWNAISNVIGDFPIMWNAVSADGQKSAKIELALSMLPDGKIDHSKIIKQIEDKVGSFNQNIQDFANMYAKVYMMMAEAGLVPNDEENAKKWTLQQLQNQRISTEDAASFYHNNVADNSVLKKYGKTVEEYQKYVTNPNGKMTINGKTYSAAKDAAHIRKILANQAVENLINGAKGLSGNTKQLSGSNNSGNANTPTTSSTSSLTSSTDQNEYASKYKSASARPTQININIDKLAHFDRTTVASSAEERDLIEAMETKIAEAVYRIFAEASNQAQSTIDLT